MSILPVILPVCGSSPAPEPELGPSESRPSQPMATSQPITVLSEDEDDEAWLEELCRVSRPTARPTAIVMAPSDDEDGDAWLQELCRAPRNHDFRSARAHDPNGHCPRHVPQSADGDHRHHPPLAGRRGQPSGDVLQMPSGMRDQSRGRSPRTPPARRGERDHVRRVLREGDPEAMIADHVQMMTWLGLRGEFDITMVPVWVRPAVACFTPVGLDRVASQAIRRTEGILEGKKICIFKIGLTHNPMKRMHNPRYGYAQRGELYSCMHVLLMSFPSVCSWVEKAAITALRGRPGCRNTAPGGESTPDRGVCYVYVVTEPCGEGRGIRTR